MSRDLPARASLEHLKKQARKLHQRLRAGDPAAEFRFQNLTHGPVPAAPQLADAQFAVAREYGFASWPTLTAHLAAAGGAAAPVEELVAAVKADDAAEVRHLLEQHPTLKRRLDDPLPGFGFGGTVLLAGRRNREMVDLLLAAGANINQRSHWWAGSFGVLDEDLVPALVDWLVSRGATMDAYAAARHRRLDTLRQLVARDPAVVNMRGGDGQTPLHVTPSVEIAAFLLDHGADIDALDVDHESSPAQYLVKDHPDVARYLVSRGAKTDILMAAALGDLALVRRYLDADPASLRTTMTEQNFPMRGPRAFGTIYIWTLGRNKTPHELAWEFGHRDVYDELMARSPEDLQLAIAGQVGDEALLAELVARRPELVATLGDDARRKLVDAAQDENLAAVRRMLGAGWPVGVIGQHGATALHWAAFHGHLELVREILRYHPPLEVKDSDFGGTPLSWAIYGAAHSGHPQRGDYEGTKQALLAAGALLP